MRHAALGAGADHAAQRLNALAMPGNTRHQPALRPATVAIHDDGDVPRHVSAGRRRLLLAGRHAGYARLIAQTASRSFSFSASILTISPMNKFVSFYTSSWEQRSSSSDTNKTKTMSFNVPLASRRMLRTAT